MEFIAKGQPEVCLGLVTAYFESDAWPYREKTSVGRVGMGGQAVRATISNKSMIDTPTGCLTLAILTAVTGGAFLLVYLVWYFLVHENPPEVFVRADTVGVNKTRLTVRATVSDHADPVAEWIERELVEKRKAAGANRASHREHSTASTDITDQIRKLAELRDAGAITEEEFEAKKRDLLDRI